MTTADARVAVVAESVSWVGTKFHLNSRIKGLGCDCAQLILASYAAADIALDIQPAQCSRDWFAHAEDRRFIDPMRAIAREVEFPLPGDCVLFFIGKSWAHAAIVTQWPMVVHSKWNSGVQFCDASQYELAKLPKLFFSPWPGESV